MTDQVRIEGTLGTWGFSLGYSGSNCGMIEFNILAPPPAAVLLTSNDPRLVQDFKTILLTIQEGNWWLTNGDRRSKIFAYLSDVYVANPSRRNDFVREYDSSPLRIRDMMAVLMSDEHKDWLHKNINLTTIGPAINPNSYNPICMYIIETDAKA